MKHDTKQYLHITLSTKLGSVFIYKECALLAALLIPAEGQNMSNIRSFGVHAKHKSRAGCESTILTARLPVWTYWAGKNRQKQNFENMSISYNFDQFETVTWGSVKTWPFLRHTCPRDLIFCFLHRLTWLQHPISWTFSLFQWNRTICTLTAKHFKTIFPKSETHT